MDIPTFDWPQAPLPALKYPLEAHSIENAAMGQQCLLTVETLIKTWKFPVAGLIVEPIQSEGGDNHASPEFFQGLRAITKRHGVTMIVDEVQPGISLSDFNLCRLTFLTTSPVLGFGPTGKFWAHEYWDLASPPDIVTFSKKAQSAGFYFQEHRLVPDKPYRHFNTCLGDPARVLMSKAVVQEILNKRLVEQAVCASHKPFGS